jgi:hypothetical protein
VEFPVPARVGAHRRTAFHPPPRRPGINSRFPRAMASDVLECMALANPGARAPCCDPVAARQPCGQQAGSSTNLRPFGAGILRRATVAQARTVVTSAGDRSVPAGARTEQPGDTHSSVDVSHGTGEARTRGCRGPPSGKVDRRLVARSAP